MIIQLQIRHSTINEKSIEYIFVDTQFIKMLG
uniref:Uncharacterized protein n=1 Tax=Lepeophtheirus salmonis TaxID=72036 RepID=A0A0K2TQ30_LEPSM